MLRCGIAIRLPVTIVMPASVAMIGIQIPRGCRAFEVDADDRDEARSLRRD